MEKVDYSTNSKRINDLYTKIVRGDGSTSYGVFTVDKSNVLDATASGPGDLTDFVEEFNDGEVQFGLARVTVPGSDVYKNILLGWCPDNAPSRLRLSFAPTFAEIARIFAGYHIQITARDSDDLDVDDMLSRVGAAAGARYTYHATGGSASKPAISTQTKASNTIPTTKPQNSSSVSPLKGSSSGAPPSIPRPIIPLKVGIPTKSSSTDDGWGDEKAIEERDFEKQPLEDVPSAYKPTKVNIEELRGQKSDTISSHPKGSNISANADPKEELPDSKPLNERTKAYQSDNSERLTSLPKPKIGNSVSGRFPFTSNGNPSVVKPTFGSKPTGSVTSSKKDLPGGVFQNHANENGLSPAQAWAQKRGKYAVDPSSQETEVQNDIARLSVSENKQKDSLDSIISSETSKVSLEKQASTEITPNPVLPPINEPVTGKSVIEKVDPAKQYDSQIDKEQGSAQSVEVKSTLNDSADSSQVQSTATGSVSTHSITAIAQYDYEKDEDNEVSFEEGDIIVDIEFVDEDWWSGKNSRTGDSGVFPGSYVSLKETSSIEKDEETVPVESTQTQQADKPSGKSAIAEYDYEKEEDNEIGFSEGDLIVDIEFVDEDWWSGRHSVTGEVGVFPGNFVALQ